LVAMLDGWMVERSVDLSVVLRADPWVEKWAVKSADSTAGWRVESSVVQ
jgi:hypothetical protein